MERILFVPACRTKDYTRSCTRTLIQPLSRLAADAPLPQLQHLFIHEGALRHAVERAVLSGGWNSPQTPGGPSLEQLVPLQSAPQ